MCDQDRDPAAAGATEYVHENQDDLVELAQDLLAANSQNPPGDTDEVATVVRDAIEDVGLNVETIAVDPAKPNLLAEIPGERDLTLCYNGHLDVVPYDADRWSRNPLGQREGDRLYGRGATDMKGAVAAMISTARAYQAIDESPPVGLAFTFVSDEETGGDAGLPALLEDFDADGCVIGETTSTRGRYSITVADRGSIWLTLQAVGKGAHGSRPSIGVNAIDELWTAISDLRDNLEHCDLTMPDDLGPIIDASVEYYAPVMGEAQARNTFQYPTVNLGTITGGETINAVAESAVARLDVRVISGVDIHAILADIRECLGEHDRVELTDVTLRVGTYESADSPIAAATAETAEQVLDETVLRRSATGGGDSRVFRNAGIPTVEFGVGTPTAHSADEYTTVDALARNAAVYAALPASFDRQHAPNDD